MDAARIETDAQPVSHHVAVMVTEVLELLHPHPGARLLDGTVGGGGHAVALLAASAPTGTVLGLDRDADALAVARQHLAPFGTRCLLVHANFSQARRVVAEVGWDGVDAVLLDLGMSSLQIEQAERGFSFQRPGPLDMRMDRQESEQAADLINQASVAELQRIFHDWGEERAAGALARAVVRDRTRAPLGTTTALVDTIARVVKRKPGDHRHPATRAFQALRIAVNHELEHLTAFLHDGYQLLRAGGRLAILSYHSLEDRLVKNAFRRWAAACLCPPRVLTCVCGWSPKVRILTPKPLTPTPAETARNPRARSARLRAVERC